MDLIEILCLVRVNRGTLIIEKPIQIYMKAGSMNKWVDGRMRCRGALIFIRLLFFLHFENNNCLQYNRIKVNLLIKCEEDKVGSMSVKHGLIVSNSE